MRPLNTTRLIGTPAVATDVADLRRLHSRPARDGDAVRRRRTFHRRSNPRVPRSRRRPLATVRLRPLDLPRSASNTFVGYGGIKHATVEALDEIELAYAITSDHWRKGFATEISLAALKHAFDTLRLDRIVAFTLPHNRASRAVMEHCGFTYTRDITHANLPHVLYIALDHKFKGRSTASFLNSKVQGLPCRRKRETHRGFHIQ